MYDLIGDIHGYGDELVALLEQMGYHKTQGAYRHPERQAIFVGDFVDRGPQIRQVLNVVRPMVEEGYALAVMGNHELNAWAFHTQHPEREGSYLRERNVKNIRGHSQTILQLSDREITSALQWFQTLPLWLDLDEIRVVHACWDEVSNAIIQQALEKHGGATADFFHLAVSPDNEVYDAVETILKGKELTLPVGYSFQDADGHTRQHIRTHWYRSPVNSSYQQFAFERSPIDCQLIVDPAQFSQRTGYPADAKPVFFGHYWLWSDRPGILADNVACLDYSVAKGGFLCAYRWSGERKLDNQNFVWVNSRPLIT